MPKVNTKRQARCPICKEKMKLIATKQISAKYECSKHGQFIVAFLEESDEKAHHKNSDLP